MTRYRGVALCIITSYILCQFSVIDGRTATTKAPPTSTKKNDTKSAAGKLPVRTGGQIITLRFGNDGNVPEEQCECKLFYLCNQENTVDTTQSGQKCSGDLMVCCLVETETEPTVLTSSTDTQPVTSAVDPEPSPSPSPVEDCRCVQPDRCLKTYEQLRRWSAITIKAGTSNTCNAPEYCCPEEFITKNNTAPTVTTPVVTPSPNDSTFDCGLKNTGVDILNRIVSPNHLRNTSFGEFPWMALLLTAEIDSTTGQRLDNVFVCGASLISSKIVLTAGHCVHDVSNVNLLKVRVGEYDTRAEANKEQKPHQDRQVLKITQHPQFNSKTLYNDLALLEVVEPFVFDYHVRPICVPLIANVYDYDPTNCVATGWGKNAFGDSEYSTTLRKVDLTVIPNDRCQEDLRKTSLGPYFILDPSFICAGGQAGMDTCEGDGGGPLVCLVRNTLNKYVQVGIVSWGIGCANGLPAAYAKLEKNVEWLTQEFYATTVFGHDRILAFSN